MVLKRILMRILLQTLRVRETAFRHEPFLITKIADWLMP